MICMNCKEREATQFYWSAGWISAHEGPSQFCRACAVGWKDFQHVVSGEEAHQRFKAIKEFIASHEVQKYIAKLKLLKEKGELLKGKLEVVTLLTRALVKYDGDYYIVQWYTITNLGQDTFWFDKLEWK